MKSKSSFFSSVDLRIIVVALVYYAAAYFGHNLAFKDTTLLPIWPASGVGLACVILLGKSSWPGIMIGALLSSLMGSWNTEALSVQAVISLCLVTSMALTLEVLAGNYLIKAWVRDVYPFSTTVNAFRFLLVGIVISLLSSTITSIGFALNGVVQQKQLLNDGLAWWISNAVGILLFSPFILSCVHFVHIKLSKERLIEVLVLVAVTVGLVFLLRVHYSSSALQRAIPFLVLPVLLWLAFRFQLAVAIGSVLLVSIIAVYVTMRGIGPLVLENPDNSIVLLQIFIGVMAMSTLVLSATVRERTDAEKKIMLFNETLEEIVRNRTKELNEEILTRSDAEKKLQHTNAELSKRNAELDSFVYSVSHDLRAPIASVLGLINLAKKEDDLAMKDMYLDMMNRSALQQDHFIKEILDQSRNARLEVKREEIFFEPIVEEMFHQLKFSGAVGQSVEKIVNIRQDRPFYSDSWRLKVILNNVLSNAIRYRNGHDPVIKVDIDVKEGDAALTIEDNGRGIAKEHLQNVCKMFYRATDDGHGSGLGLYIVKETIDKLNGSIRIDSELGKGTSIKLNIPEVV